MGKNALPAAGTYISNVLQRIPNTLLGCPDPEDLVFLLTLLFIDVHVCHSLDWEIEEKVKISANGVQTPSLPGTPKSESKPRPPEPPGGSQPWQDCQPGGWGSQRSAGERDCHCWQRRGWGHTRRAGRLQFWTKKSKIQNSKFKMRKKIIKMQNEKFKISQKENVQRPWRLYCNALSSGIWFPVTPG